MFFFASPFCDQTLSEILERHHSQSEYEFASQEVKMQLRILKWKKKTSDLSSWCFLRNLSQHFRGAKQWGLRFQRVHRTSWATTATAWIPGTGIPWCNHQLVQGSLDYQPKQCITIREIPENYHRCVLFGSPQMGNIMTPVVWAQFLGDFFSCHNKK